MSATQFTNLTPDVTPIGTPIPLGSGLRYFYFMFIAPASYIDLFLSRNRYRNEEYITRLYSETSATSLLTSTNVTNITYPTIFSNGYIGLSTPGGATYINNTNTPNCRIRNLTPGAVYYIESRTIYNDSGVDFGLYIKSGISTAPITYMRTETTSIPFPPTPPPPPPPPSPDGIPLTPTGLTAVSGTYGVILSWMQSINATFYHVYRFGRFIGKTASLKFIDSNIISGGFYSYTVAAANANGESAQTSPVTIFPIFLFTNLVPDKTAEGVTLVGSGVRYFYHLFTPLVSSLDVFLQFSGHVNQSAIVGLYDASNPSVNLLNITNTIIDIDANLVQGNFTLGTAPDPQVTVYGIRFTSIGAYINNTSIPNFKINNLLTSLTTYILETVTVSNNADDTYPDLGIYMKNSGSGLFSGHTTQITYNTTSLSRVVPTPYLIAYNFTSTSQTNFSTFIYPNLHAFQHAKNVLENVISVSPGARGVGRANDMLVNFTVTALPSGVLGQSSISKWKDDRTRSPDFPYEQDITFSSAYFSNGHFSSNAKFNGSDALNGVTNTALFNVLIHEMLHGIGIYYSGFYNSTNMDIGWNQFLTNVSEGDPWYKGPAAGDSAALTSYKLDCKNNNLLRIPIEKDFGAETANTHWDEGNTSSSSSEKRYFSTLYHPAFRYELMTGFINKDDYLTGLTAGALKDYGYNINMNSPYVAGYPFNLIPTASMQPMFIESNHKCIHRDNMHTIIDYSLSTVYCSTMMQANQIVPAPVVTTQYPQFNVVFHF